MRTYATGREAVYDVCQRILREGTPVEVRGMPTLELLHERFAIEHPTDPIPDGINRAKLNPAMAALEFLQNVAGFSCPELFSRIAPASSKASRLMYGERLAGQIDRVAEKLVADPTTREAVATIWRHDDLGSGNEPNLCTIGIQFILRGGLLDAATFMRSNDAWWGLAYDIPQFAQLQVTMANVLGVGVGRYVHHATSMHLYDRHWNAADSLTPPAPGLQAELCGVDGPYPGERAAQLLRGELPPSPTPSEQRFHGWLAPYKPEGK